MVRLIMVRMKILGMMVNRLHRERVKLKRTVATNKGNGATNMGIRGRYRSTWLKLRSPFSGFPRFAKAGCERMIQPCPLRTKEYQHSMIEATAGQQDNFLTTVIRLSLMSGDGSWWVVDE